MSVVKNPTPPSSPVNRSLKTSAQLKLLNELSIRLQSLLTAENLWEEILNVVQNKFHYYSFMIWSVTPDRAATLKVQSGAYNNYI